MRINTEKLEAIRNLLGTASAALEQQSKEARESEEERVALDGRVRGLVAAFDTCAGAFAQDIELSSRQLDSLPEAVQQLLGRVIESA